MIEFSGCTFEHLCYILVLCRDYLWCKAPKCAGEISCKKSRDLPLSELSWWFVAPVWIELVICWSFVAPVWIELVICCPLPHWKWNLELLTECLPSNHHPTENKKLELLMENLDFGVELENWNLSWFVADMYLEIKVYTGRLQLVFFLYRIVLNHY